MPNGKEFDEERKVFIRNFNTIDLQAVPGSGKTTALLAKLVILERRLPFADGSGILVLSHTNGAIDEIKEKFKIILRNCSHIQILLAQYKVLLMSFGDSILRSKIQ